MPFWRLSKAKERVRLKTKRGSFDKRKCFGWAVGILTALFVLVWAGNCWIVPARYTVKTTKPLPDGELRIAQISDLHGEFFDSKQMFSLIKEHRPDVIAVTGDVFTRGHYDEPSLAALAKRLTEIAPTFYVSGNHEAAGGYLTEIETTLRQNGVTVLSNESREFENVTVVGMEDYAYFTAHLSRSEASAKYQKTLYSLTESVADDRFTLLLSHRPDEELVDYYTQSGADLTLSGHVHGGVIRIPFLGGVFSVDGLFPTYDAGAFELESGGALVISAGLGNGLAGFRIFNPPEVTLITVENQ